MTEHLKKELWARYEATKSSLLNNQFGRPISLISAIDNNILSGEIIGIIEFPFSLVGSKLDEPPEWCEALMLHVNTKACTFKNGNIGKIHLYGGRKSYQAPEQSSRITLDFIHQVQQDDFMALKLFSDIGPYGTKNYQIEFMAIPLINDKAELQSDKTLVRLAFSYRIGWLARQTIRLYLATLGHNKVGFTITEIKQGRPIYIKGFKGIIERNTMRYYLALDTVLNVEKSDDDPLKRYRYWHQATQRFPRQLHEVDTEKYLTNKAREIQNQQRIQSQLDSSS